MSDIDGAAPAAAEGTSAPEVEVNAPEVEVTPRGSIDRAFAALDAQESGEPEAKVEQPKQEPTEEQPKSGPDRGPDGKFKAKEQTENPEAAAEPEKAEEPKAEAEKTGITEPPARFSADAKAAWKDVPDSVKGEVSRAIRELETGFQKYREGASEYESVRDFAEMAKRGGTDLKTALTAYTGIESAWRNDPAQGFVAVCQNMGVNPVQQAQEILARISGQPVEHGSSPAEAQLRMENQALQARLDALEGGFNEIRTQPVIQQMQEFTAKEPFFQMLVNSGDIEGEIVRIKGEGRTPTLEEAFDAAIQKYPDLVAARAARTQNSAPVPNAASAAVKPDPAAQTRKGSLSVTGAPSSGSNPTNRKPPSSPKEALDNAFAQLGIG